MVVAVMLGGSARWIGNAPAAHAEQLFQLRNGLAIRGTKIELPTLRDGFAAASASDGHLRPIWLIDDGLRRHYIHGRTMVVGNPVDVAAPGVSITFPQPRPTGGSVVGSMGTILGRSGFNDFGRRRLTVRGPDGSPIDVIQGITEINPRYAKLETLKNEPSLIWDMRVATSSIPSSTLDRVFSRVVDSDDLDGRLELVRFYTDAGRYGDASRALSAIIDDFPATDDLRPLLVSLVGRSAEQLLEEAERRIKVGQTRLARQILTQFPSDKIGRVMKIRVAQLLETIDNERSTVDALVKRLRGQLTDLNVPDPAELVPMVEEIAEHLSPATLSRLADYQRLGGVDNIPLENRVSLAISGWLLGSGAGQQNLAVTRSMYRVRDLTRRFLASKDPANRAELVRLIRREEAGSTRTIDALAPLWRPVLAFAPEQSDGSIDGFFHVDVPGVEALPLDILAAGNDGSDLDIDDRQDIDPVDYHLQLPPEYDPNVSYPVVVALGPSRSDPAAEIDWWCGKGVGKGADANEASGGDESGGDESGGNKATSDPGAMVRSGHAARGGMIVLSVRWGRPSQRLYEYTAVEHHRVLASLRHAMRRTSIDADRVYLAGHGEGGTAAWDMTLTHPDVFAGLIAVSAKPDKSVLHYEENGYGIAKYIVFGQLDPDAPSGSVLDTYISSRHDALIVMYRGRGRDRFFDEVPRMMDWMASPTNVRAAVPESFEVATMRAGDRRFWWLELDQINPEIVVDPVQWSGRIRAGTVTGSIGSDNLIRFSGPADGFTLHLRPMSTLDFDAEVRLRHGNRTTTKLFDGDVTTILRDLDARADRRRPTWMVVRYP